MTVIDELPVSPASWGSRLHAWVQLVRPANSVAAAALVGVGATLAGSALSMRGWLAVAAMWSVTAAAYVANDLADMAEDRVNKPHRPLPSGRVTPREAQRLRRGLVTGAMLCAAAIDWIALTAAGIVLAALWLYDRRLKATPGWGNGLIALLAGCALLTGAVAAKGFDPGDWLPILPAATTLTCFVASREVLKTVEDVPGDRLLGKRTLAVRWGIPATLRLYAALAFATIILSWVPFLRQGYSVAYLGLMLVGVHLPLLRPLFTQADTATPARTRGWLRWLKVSYLMGIAALLLA